MISSLTAEEAWKRTLQNKMDAGDTEDGYVRTIEFINRTLKLIDEDISSGKTEPSILLHFDHRAVDIGTIRKHLEQKGFKVQYSSYDYKNMIRELLISWEGNI